MSTKIFGVVCSQLSFFHFILSLQLLVSQIPLCDHAAVSLCRTWICATDLATWKINNISDSHLICLLLKSFLFSCEKTSLKVCCYISSQKRSWECSPMPFREIRTPEFQVPEMSVFICGWFYTFICRIKPVTVERVARWQESLSACLNDDGESIVHHWLRVVCI